MRFAWNARVVGSVVRPLLVLLLVIGAAVEAEAQPVGPDPNTTPRRSPFYFEQTMTLGASYVLARSRYHSDDSPRPPDCSVPDGDCDSARGLAPSGDLGVVLGGWVAEHVATGAFLRLGATGIRSAFTGRLAGWPFAITGVQILFVRSRRRGPYASARTGLAIVGIAVGWTLGAIVGYRAPIGDTWNVSLGLDLAAMEVHWSEEGDFGVYRYVDRFLTSALTLSFAH